jgi:hypothetical protein
MEWRIFIPCHSVRDTREEFQVSSAAVALLHDVLATLNALRPAGVPVETRTDNYIVGMKYFGLKFRHGDKLELKTMLESSNIGVERYKKIKFGKKLKKYEEDIIQELSRCGHTNENLHRSLLHAAQSIEIKKSRVVGHFGHVSLEVVDLEFLMPCNAPKHWCSIAVESDNIVAINSFVASNALIRRLIGSIGSYVHIYKHSEQPLVLPLLGGYPTFVLYVSKGCEKVMALETLSPLLSNLFP